MVIFALLLTVIGAFMAQVNALVLRYTVDEITALTKANKTVQEGFSLLVTISIILLTKEFIYVWWSATTNFYRSIIPKKSAYYFSG